MRLAKSNMLTRAFVHRPCLVILINVAVLLTATILVFSLDLYGLTLQNNRDFFNWDHIMTYRFDEREVAETALQQNSDSD